MVTGPWLGARASIVEDMKVLLHSQANADVEIVVSGNGHCPFMVTNKGRVFKCHKIILEARCPLLLEKSAQNLDPVHFALFLEFVYCDRLGVTKEVAQGLLSLAEYFKVTHIFPPKM